MCVRLNESQTYLFEKDNILIALIRIAGNLRYIQATVQVIGQMKGSKAIYMKIGEVYTWNNTRVYIKEITNNTVHIRFLSDK